MSLERKLIYFKIQYINILTNLDFSNRFLLWMNFGKPQFQYILSIIYL